MLFRFNNEGKKYVAIFCVEAVGVCSFKSVFPKFVAINIEVLSVTIYMLFLPFAQSFSHSVNFPTLSPAVYF